MTYPARMWQRIVLPLGFVIAVLILRIGYIALFADETGYRDFPILAVVPGFMAYFITRALLVDKKPRIIRVSVCLVIGLVLTLLFEYATALRVWQQPDSSIAVNPLLILLGLFATSPGDWLFAGLGLIIGLIMFWQWPNPDD